MSLGRREGLVKLARKYDALIISDDVYDLLQWSLTTPVSTIRPPEMRLLRICDIDRALGPCDNDPHGFGHAVSNGSFTKIAGPSVRTGWAEAAPAFIAGLARAASTRSGGAPSQLCAAMLAEVVENGQLQRFVDETVRPALQQRHGLMIDAIRSHVSPLGARTRAASLKGCDVFGGYFVWMDIDSDFSTKFIAGVLRSEEDIIIGHGQMFTVHGDEESASFDKSVRLSFSWEAEEDIVDGIKRIGLALARIQANKEYYLKVASAPSNIG
ncbi:Pyridoxal phosphate-dependent transferase, major domain protein [Cordyceps fumosorosea ARSEF 2679]|uniref:Pyridoxal phosphate-dependent transferase, major domain protein n=1 Tax=Cordyceps fumosorosea (strain ARSEF 2679) TaxID=1081104 RepID=A0A167ALV2_CORFA|nr:Pyridoxal phosphate-dependent transferase, major domain protein [Cordyceps fumosorosea ARSEF 2679]OAA39050.1 Pyridoxal phosphate-dependent transferase, major domain protein [Cordyceps fumosorosea ARSEF 2679]